MAVFTKLTETECHKNLTIDLTTEKAQRCTLPHIATVFECGRGVVVVGLPSAESLPLFWPLEHIHRHSHSHSAIRTIVAHFCFGLVRPALIINSCPLFLSLYINYEYLNNSNHCNCRCALCQCALICYYRCCIYCSPAVCARGAGHKHTDRRCSRHCFASLALMFVPNCPN